MVRAVRQRVNQLECLPRTRLERPYSNWTSPRLPVHPALGLCETEAEVVYLAKRADLKLDSLIALTPQSACQCHMMGLPYLKIEDFFDVMAFWTADEPMLALQSRWSDRVDAFLWEANPAFQQHGFRPAGHYFFFLKVMSDMLFRAAFGLAHLFLSSQPRQVFYFAGEETGAVPETLFFNGPIYRLVLPACAEEYGVAATPLPALPGTEGPSAKRGLNLRRKLLDLLPPPVIARLQWTKSMGVSSLFLGRNARATTPTIVFSEATEVNLVVQRAQAEGLRLKWLADVVEPFRPTRQVPDDLSRSLEEWWAQVSPRDFFREPFVWCGVDLCRVAETRLRYWWHTLIPAMWQMFLQARTRFKIQRPQAVFMFSPWRPEEHSALQAARSLKIPTVTYQHGGFEGNCEYTTYDMTDLRQSDYRLVYGEGVATYLQERAARCDEARAHIISVGSARLDALRLMPDRRTRVRQRLRIADSEELVLYLPTSYQYNWYMARQSYLGVPYFELLVRVMETLREFPRLRFVYKPFPELPFDPITKVIAMRCPNCHVITDISVPQLLQASDAFIVDIPSTGLLEALLTDKPVLVFSDSRFVALRPEARTLLCKRVTLSETPDDYLEQLRLFLSRGSFQELENADREFLRAYGTHWDDGRSAHRAVEALQEIVCGQGSPVRDG